MDQWHVLKVELHKEAEAILNSSGDVVLVDSGLESQSGVALVSRTKHLKLTYIPERNAVKWDTPNEYGVDPIPMPAAPLAATLMQRVYRPVDP